MVDLTDVKQSIDDKVRKSRVDMELQREQKDILISQVRKSIVHTGGIGHNLCPQLYPQLF